MNYNNKENIIIGIDTSCYTTSIAAISLDKRIIFSEKIMLNVKKGTNGLRQSDGVFQHINNLELLSERLKNIMKTYEVSAICASSKPRPIKDSYMPVFRVGENFSKLYANLNGCMYYETTHQENHIKASLYNKALNKSNKFISIHMSGGTTEILLVEDNNKKYNISIIGGTLDVSFGQIIDRTGVRLGYDFPCGKYIDDNSLNCTEDINSGLKTSVKNGYMNLSGLENQVNKLIDEKYSNEYISKILFNAICKNLSKSLKYLCEEYNIDEVVFAGGVSSSKYISNKIKRDLNKEGITSYFTIPEYSADNALGCAIIGLENFLGE